MVGIGVSSRGVVGELVPPTGGSRVADVGEVLGNPKLIDIDVDISS